MLPMTRENLIKWGAEFLGETEEEFKQHMKENAQLAINDWENRKSIADFYETTKVNIYGLVDFNDDSRLVNLKHPVKTLKGLHILDYGAGIGVFSHILADMGNTVYYYDVPSKTQDFAKFINEKVNGNLIFLKEEDVFTRQYDVIVALDVLEHLEDSMSVVKKMNAHIRTYGALVTTGLNFSFGPHTPMHLAQNVRCREEYEVYVGTEFVLLYFHSTKKETIYVWIKGGDKWRKRQNEN